MIKVVAYRPVLTRMVVSAGPPASDQHGDREQKVEQLRQELESMRSQSKALEKQLQEISKAK
ncbi:MAG: hypothetical protein NTY15_15470 [Planctomycetota bacterium]|nr:hypothetical protein [Planctomycetota bacterium]